MKWFFVIEKVFGVMERLHDNYQRDKREKKREKERKETSGVGESLLRRVSVTVALLLSVSV